MSENFTWREQLKTNFKINLLFSILWANPQGVTRAQMSQISGDDIDEKRAVKKLTRTVRFLRYLYLTNHVKQLITSHEFSIKA